MFHISIWLISNDMLGRAFEPNLPFRLVNLGFPQRVPCPSSILLRIAFVNYTEHLRRNVFTYGILTCEVLHRIRSLPLSYASDTFVNNFYRLYAFIIITIISNTMLYINS